VRLYDPTYGRFMSVDPLWKAYQSKQPYHYSLNQPISQLDPGGDVVQAMDQQARKAIVGSVEQEYRDVVSSAFREDGTLDASVLKKAAEGLDVESNIAILSRLAENDALIEVRVEDEYLATEGEGSEKVYQLLSGAETPFAGNEGKYNAGMTVLPRQDKKAESQSGASIPFSNVANNAIQVYIKENMTGTGRTKGQTAAHELYGHVRRYLMWKLGKASDFWHGAPKTEAAIKKAEDNSSKSTAK